MAAPSWTDLQQIVPLTKVAAGGKIRGQLNLQNLFAGYVFMKVAPLGTGTPSNGIYVMTRRLLFDSGSGRLGDQPLVPMFQSGTTAANSTTLNGNPTAPTTVNVSNVSNVNNPTITTSSAHGLVTGDLVTIASVGGATGVNGTFNVASVPSPTTFTITASAPGAYTSGGTVAGVDTVTLTSATGFAGNQLVAITDSTSSPTRCSWRRTSKISSTTLTLDSPLSNSSIASGDTILNQCYLPPPYPVDGTPNPGNLEVIFDNGLESTVAYAVEAYFQSLNSIG